MKKSILTLAITLLTIVAFSQQTTSIKRYKINTTGTSNGLTIPAGFVVSIDAVYIKGISLNNDTLKMEAQLSTYLNDSTTVVVKNDNVQHIQTMYSTLQFVNDSTDSAILPNQLYKGLVLIYGSGNVIKL